MRYTKIPSTLFIKNREKFISKMEPNSIAIFTSNDVMPNNADDVMGFAQNNDLFYLSGIDQEESILVLYPEAALPSNREILFVKETNEQIKIWEGDKLTQEQAFEVSGVKNVKWLQDLELTIQHMAFEADTFYLGRNEEDKSPKPPFVCHRWFSSSVFPLFPWSPDREFLCLQQLMLCRLR